MVRDHAGDATVQWRQRRADMSDRPQMVVVLVVCGPADPGRRQRFADRTGEHLVCGEVGQGCTWSVATTVGRSALLVLKQRRRRGSAAQMEFIVTRAGGQGSGQNGPGCRVARGRQRPLGMKEILRAGRGGLHLACFSVRVEVARLKDCAPSCPPSGPETKIGMPHRRHHRGQRRRQPLYSP